MPCCAELEGNGKLPNGRSGHKAQANSSGLKSFSGVDGSKSPRLLPGHVFMLARLMLI